MSNSTPDRPFWFGRGIRDRIASVRGAQRPESSDNRDKIDREFGAREAARRISEALNTHAIYLDLARCALSTIPPEVFEMTWLESLNLEENNISDIPRAIARLTNLKDLDLWQNSLKGIPDDIGDLSELSKLTIGPGLTQLPKSIVHCRHLQTLILGGNHFGTLPSWLAELHELKELELWGNDLQSVPDWWQNFPHLRLLSLADNRLSTIPPSVGELSELERLELSDNALTDLPTSLQKLKSLRVASLANNDFRAIPDAVTRWSGLEFLDLSFGEGHIITRLSSGTTLVGRIPRPTFGRKSALEALHPDMRRLAKLRVLLLRGNDLLQLPDELLGEVPDIFPDGEWQGSVEGILDYYFRTRGGARSLNEAKLILLGWGGVGKTSLVKRLVHGSFDPAEERTEGIEVTSWPVALANDEHVRLNVWDFGGQEIMHATHQFFLTSRRDWSTTEISEYPRFRANRLRGRRARLRSRRPGECAARCHR